MRSFFFADCQCNNTFSMPTIIVQIIDDLAFEFILIGRIYNTFWIAAFEVDVDINATLGNSCGLTPVDLTQVITVFIFLHNGVAELFHNFDINTKWIAKWNCRFILICANQTMVGCNNDIPTFIKQVHEATQVSVSIYVEPFHDILEELFIIPFNMWTIFRDFPERMSSDIYVMKMGEYSFIAIFFDQRVHGVCLPFRVRFPQRSKDLICSLCRIPDHHRNTTKLTSFFLNLLKQRFWMEQHIVVRFHGIAIPHLNSGTIFSHFDQNCLTNNFNLFAFLAYGIHNVIHYDINLIKYSKWFCILLGSINGNFIVHALIIRNNQHWTTFHATTYRNAEFFRTCWRISPTFCFFERNSGFIFIKLWLRCPCIFAFIFIHDHIGEDFLLKRHI